jgi:hypothetical protein
LDLESAFEKHGGWIEEFCTAIFNQDTLDAATYEKDKNCELGKWLYGEANALYSGLNAYTNLITSHAEFHKVAGRVVQAINSKDYKQAEYLLGNDGNYAVASHSVYIAILKLKKETHL